MQTCITSTEWEVELSATAVIIEDDDEEDSVMPCKDRMIRITVTRDWDMAPSVPSLASAGHRGSHSISPHCHCPHTRTTVSVEKLSTAVATTGHCLTLPTEVWAWSLVWPAASTI